MPEKEYNDHFVICLTPGNGTQVICNPETIQIFFKLYCKEMSITELSKVTDIQKNTVRGKVTNLISKGIIVGRRDENDARSTLYRTCASPILIDNNYMPWTYPPVENILNNMLDNPESFQQYFVSVFTRAFAEAGIDLRPFHMEAGSSLFRYNKMGNSIADMVNSGTIDNLVKLKNPPMEVSVTCRGALVMTVKSNEVLSDDRTLIFATLIGLLTSSLPRITGKNYVHLPRKVMNGDRTIAKITMAQYDGKYFDDCLPLLSERPNGFYRCSEPFAIYSINGHSFLFTNEIMLEILNNLDTEKSIKELTANMQYSRISIHSALNKLIEIGAVLISDITKKKDRIYKPNFKRILYSIPPTLEHPAVSMSLSMDRSETLEHYYKIVNTFTMEVLDCIGIDIEYIVDRACQLSSKVILEKYPGITKSQYVEKICSQFRDTVSFDNSKPGTLIARPIIDSYCNNLGLHYFNKITTELLDNLPGDDWIDIRIEYGKKSRFGCN